jgi:glucuronosyltransferase
LWNYGVITSKIALESPVVKKFIETDRTAFDVVIAEQFQQESFNMFAHKYNCPLITIGTLDYADFMDRAKGALTAWSHVPHFLSDKSDRMTFFDRVENTIVSLYDALGRKFYYLPKQTQVARQAFEALENQQGGRLPTVEDLEKKISLHLINSHPALSYPRPKMPGMVDIAGIHILPPKPLPSDIQAFLDGAEHGLIYISFGSFLKSSEMPKEKFQAMLTVFKQLKQRVLWKWESEQAPDLPTNVMVKQWLPQADILAHKNVKLFISHGGIFGTQEAIYNAVPMVLFPFYGDQHLNCRKMEQRGIGLLQNMSGMTASSLSTAISRVMNNQTYYENIQKMSDIFRTNQNPPLETAVWWIEYIIKYKGAPHLQSSAKNLPWFRYLQLDIAFVVFGIIYMIYDFIKQQYDKAMAKPTETKKNKEEKSKKSKDETLKKSKEETSKKNKNKKKEN